ALVRAAHRGVRINVIVETPDRLEGQNAYSTLKALGEDVAACSTVYLWPREKRKQAEDARFGILHVKCAVADGRIMILSSANLTEQAFSLNSPHSPAHRLRNPHNRLRRRDPRTRRNAS